MQESMVFMQEAMVFMQDSMLFVQELMAPEASGNYRATSSLCILWPNVAMNRNSGCGEQDYDVFVQDSVVFMQDSIVFMQDLLSPSCACPTWRKG